MLYSNRMKKNHSIDVKINCFCKYFKLLQYLRHRKWSTLRQTARALSTSPLWETIMKDIDIPKFGQSRALEKNSKPSSEEKVPIWSRQEGIRILQEIILYGKPLDLTNDDTWKEIKQCSVRNATFSTIEKRIKL